MRNALFALLLFTSCAPLVNLQSGRSLGKGNGIITPYLHAGDIYLPRDDSEKASSFLPGAGAQFMTGITQRLDVGGKVDLSSFAVFQAKYQLLGNRTSAFAVGVGAESGIMLVPLLLGGVFYYYRLPLFFSYHPTEKVCFYASPAYSFGQRYVPKNTNGSGEAMRKNRERSGFSYGFSVGRNSCFSLEIGHYGYRLYQPTQVAVGYTFWFPK